MRLNRNENQHFSFRNADQSTIMQFAETYFSKGNHKVNFIGVNWRKGSTTINYFSARGRVKPVGEHLASFINFLVNKHKLKLNSITIVGHSLGAHIAGIGECHTSLIFRILKTLILHLFCSWKEGSWRKSE